MLNKLPVISLFLFSSYTVANMNTTKYSAYFKTQSGVCLLQINGVIYIDTLRGPKLSAQVQIYQAGWRTEKMTLGLHFTLRRQRTNTTKKIVR